MTGACTGCATKLAPGTRFCPRCGIARPAVHDGALFRRTGSPLEPRGTGRWPPGTWYATIIGLVVLGVAVASALGWTDPGVDADGGGDEASPLGEVGVELQPPAPLEDATASVPPVAGLRCQGRTGPVTCIDSVAEFDVDVGDEVRVAGSGVVVASPDGLVRAHDLGSGRERWRARFAPPVTIHPEVAGTVPVGSEHGVRFLSLAEGTAVGAFEGTVAEAVSTGPWLMVRDQDGTVAARSVTGRPGWSREVPPGGRAWLTPAGTYLDDGAGLLTSLFDNTGGDRWSTALPGTVRDVHRVPDRTVVALADPAAVAVLDARGEPLEVTGLNGSVTWSGLDPDGSHAVLVTTEETGVVALSIMEVATGRLRSTVALPGELGEAAPAVGRTLVAVPLMGADPQVRLLEIPDGRTHGRIDVVSPITAVAWPEEAVAVFDATGTLAVRSLTTNRERYRIAFGSEATLLRERPLLVLSPAGVTALDPNAG